MAHSFAARHADYGQCWGEGLARSYSIQMDFLDEAQGLRLMPVPDSFFCPISAAIMKDPVATVDGCAYEREYIERWFRERRQFRQPITSPTTGLELQSTTLMPLVALHRAIEAYLLHRPELKRDHLAGRSFEEAAQVLQSDLLEKQAVNATVHDEVHRLREANKALIRQLRETEDACRQMMQELERTRVRVRELEEERAVNTDGPDLFVEEPRAPELERLPPGSEAHSSRSDVAHGRTSEHSIDEKPQVVTCAEGGPLAPRLPEAKKVAEEEKLRRLQQKGSSALLEKVSEARVRSHERTQQLLQGMLIVVLLALCCFLQTQNLSASRMTTEAASHKSGVVEQELVARHALEIGFGLSRHVELLRSPIAQERVSAAWALQQWAHDGSDSQAATIDAEALAAFVRMLEEDAGTAKEASASALGTLASISLANQAAIAKAGAIAPLVDALRSDSSAARSEAATALRHLAGGASEDNRYPKQVAIVQAGAIKPLVRLLRDSSSTARAAAAGALRMLATDNADNQVAIAQTGAIVPLVELLGDPLHAVREEAATALGGLSVFEGDTNHGNQAAIGQAGAIASLANLLQDPIASVRLAAAGALRSLASQNADNQARVLEVGSIPALVALLKGDSVTVPTIALLRTLAASSPSSQAAIKRAGAIPHLSELLSHEDPAIRGEAADALTSLGIVAMTKV